MAINISTILIKANIQKVWDCVTKPELVKRWQYGSDLITNWDVGSDIRFITPFDDKVFEQWGKILEVKPYESLVYSLFSPQSGMEDRPENYFVMHYHLKPIADKTSLEIIQQDNRPNATQEDPQGEENPVLKMLKQLAEAD